MKRLIKIDAKHESNMERWKTSKTCKMGVRLLRMDNKRRGHKLFRIRKHPEQRSNLLHL